MITGAAPVSATVLTFLRTALGCQVRSITPPDNPRHCNAVGPCFDWQKCICIVIMQHDVWMHWVMAKVLYHFTYLSMLCVVRTLRNNSDSFKRMVLSMQLSLSSLTTLYIRSFELTPPWTHMFSLPRPPGPSFVCLGFAWNRLVPNFLGK